MKENPFASPETTAEPVVTNQPKAAADRGFEIVHNTFRGLLAFFGFGFVPVFVVPNFANMFEEFGIDLPLVLVYVIQFSRLAVSFSVFFLPLSLCVFAGIEFGLFNLSRGRSKTLLNFTYWVILILVLGSACLGLFATLTAITTGLTGS